MTYKKSITALQILIRGYRVSLHLLKMTSDSTQEIRMMGMISRDFGEYRLGLEKKIGL